MFWGDLFWEFCTDLKVLQGFIGLETIKKQREIAQKHRESSKFSPAAAFGHQTILILYLMQREGEIAAPKGDDFLKLNCKNVFRNTDTSMGFFIFQTVETLSLTPWDLGTPVPMNFVPRPTHLPKLGPLSRGSQCLYGCRNAPLLFAKHN